MSDQKSIHVSSNVNLLPFLTEEAKGRIAKDFRLSLLKEFALHDELPAAIVFKGNTHGMVVVRDGKMLEGMLK